MYTIEFVESAQKEFKKLDKEDQMRIVSVLERIRLRPYDFALRLSGSRAYRVRVGKLRLIADIIEEEKKILVVRIGNRENVYLP